MDVAIDAVGHPDALELACRLTRKAGTVSAIGVYAERIEVHMGIVWIKALTLVTGHANVIAHVDPVLAMLDAGVLDPASARHASHAPRGRARGVRRSTTAARRSRSCSTLEPTTPPPDAHRGAA